MQPTDSSTRLPQLDGLRALAILGVMLHHFGVKPCGWLDWGPVAPTVFFMISGFLITGILEKVRARGGADAFWFFGFHLRRFARLVPALYLLLAIGWFVGLPEYRDGLPWHALFLSNVHMGTSGEWAGSLSHLWSLSMQEQFYLLWPLLLVVPGKWMVRALVGIAVSAVLFRACCILLGVPDMFRWLMLPGSLDAFAVGGLLALLVRAKPGLVTPARLVPGTLAAIGCWIISRALRHLDGTGNPLLALVEVFEISAFAWLILVLVQHPRGIAARLLASGPLAAMGTISYGLFIWHMLVVSALGPHLDAAGWTTKDALWPRTLVLLGASIAFAWLSWLAIEKPSIGWARRIAESGAHTLSSWWRELSTRVSALPRHSAGEGA